MLHQFINNNYYIVMDVNSGSVHDVDPLVYLILNALGSRREDFQTQESGVTEGLEDLRAILAVEPTSQLPASSLSFGDYTVEELRDADLRAEIRAMIDSEEFDEAYDEILSLTEAGVLFTKDDYADMIDAVKERKTVVKALCLHIAHDCNLACKYCFAEEGEYHGKRGMMTPEIGKKALDFLVEASGQRRNLEVDFFGGEPLLNFDTVKEIVSYGRELEKTHDKQFRFTITTNGVLLNDEIQDYVNQEMDNVVLSLDGRQEVNDRMRPFRGGQGSYEKIVPKYQKLADSRGQERYYVRGTFTRHNLDFATDVEHFADLGFKQLSMEPVVADAKEDYAITEADLPEIFAEYDRLARRMLEREKEKSGFNFFHFMVDLSGGPCVAKRLSGCGSGTEYLAVTPWGELYPCHQFVGREEFLMGNVDEGVTSPEIADEFRRVNVYTKDDCRDCFAKFYCSGGCMANAYNESGRIDGSYELGCKMQRKRVECALMLQVAQAD